VQVWEAEKGIHLVTYHGHGDRSVNALAWSPDGREIASGQLSGTVHVWQPWKSGT